MKPILHIFLAISLFFVPVSLPAQEDEAEKKAPDLTFTVRKAGDGSYELKARLALYENRKDIPIAGADIDFSTGDVRIDGNKTDKHGVAIAFIKPGFVLPRDKDGVITVNAEYAGNEQYESASSEFIFTETKIVLTCELVDSVKTALVSAFRIGAGGKETPLADETVIVSVQRMFSRLPIGEANLDETGKGFVEFPDDLPGDSLGNLHVIAYIHEHDTYGNSEADAIAPWGIPKQKVHVTHRALWTQIAPLWMIVSLTILLIGVWAHYVYVAYQIYLVRKKGKTHIVE